MTSYLKNQLFSPLGILFGDGSMMHLRSREEVDASDLDMGDTNLKNMLDKGYVAIKGADTNVNVQTAEENLIEVSTRQETDDTSGEEAEEPTHNSIE
jgi:hypothetical protein